MRFRGILDTITRVRGVRGAMIVGYQDGLVISESLMEDVRGNAVAALTASLTKHVANATSASGAGEPQFLHMQAADGALLAVAGGTEILVIAIAAPTRGTARDTLVAPPPLAPAELSREWRQTPKAVNFDHMFRNNRSSAGSAWIREGGARR